MWPKACKVKLPMANIRYLSLDRKRYLFFVFIWWGFVSVVCQAYEEPEISCLAYIPRWRYDPETRTCENFVYGGCGGNANNFETIEACEGKCLETNEVTTPENRDRNNRVSSWRGISHSFVSDYTYHLVHMLETRNIFCLEVYEK